MIWYFISLFSSKPTLSFITTTPLAITSGWEILDMCVKGWKLLTTYTKWLYAIWYQWGELQNCFMYLITKLIAVTVTRNHLIGRGLNFFPFQGKGMISLKTLTNGDLNVCSLP